MVLITNWKSQKLNFTNPLGTTFYKNIDGYTVLYLQRMHRLLRKRNTYWPSLITSGKGWMSSRPGWQTSVQLLDLVPLTGDLCFNRRIDYYLQVSVKKLGFGDVECVKVSPVIFAKRTMTTSRLSVVNRGYRHWRDSKTTRVGRRLFCNRHSTSSVRSHKIPLPHSHSLEKEPETNLIVIRTVFDSLSSCSQFQDVFGEGDGRKGRTREMEGVRPDDPTLKVAERLRSSSHYSSDSILLGSDPSSSLFPRPFSRPLFYYTIRL